MDDGETSVYSLSSPPPSSSSAYAASSSVGANQKAIAKLLRSPSAFSSIAHVLSDAASLRSISSEDMSTRLVELNQEQPPHTCSICGYVARDKSNLRKHFYTHTGEKPFQCQWCNYKTTQSSNLHTHTRRHHPSVILPPNFG